MLHKLIYIILFASSVLSRHVLHRYTELDEEDQRLFRAAYETPAYDNDEYQENDDLSVGKLDLLKDGLWALKAKMKELKAFNKAMVANLLSTKLTVKDLIESSIALKKHHHVEKKKPSYSYQAPSYQQYHQQPQYNIEYTEPQYTAQHTHDPYYGN